MNFKQKILILCVGLFGLFLIPFLTNAASVDWQQSGSDGLGNANNPAIYALEEFDGYFYAGTWNIASGTEIYRTADMETWELVSSDGFGGVLPDWYVYDFQEFNGELYASTYNDFIGGSIYKTSNGTTWTKVGSAGFNDLDNKGITKLYEAGGLLVAGTSNLDTGAEVWFTLDGDNWFQTGTDGFDDPNNAFVGNMIEFNNYLYVTFYNATTGGQIFRKTTTGNWETVTANGLGDATNLNFMSLAEVNGTLYVGSRRDGGANLYSTTNGMAYTSLATLTSVQQNIRDMYYLDDPSAGLFLSVDNGNGFDLLIAQPDGSTTAAVSPGFGNTTNVTGNQLADFGNRLVIGTGKISGGAGEVWYADYRTPTKPTGIKVPAKQRKVVSAKIKWNTATADKYYLKLTTKKGKAIKTFKKITADYKVINKKFLKSNAPYKVKVRSVFYSGGKSNWSKIKSFRTKPAKVKNVAVTENKTVGGKDITYDAVLGNGISYTIKVLNSNGDTVYTFITDTTSFFIPYLAPGDYQVKVRAKYNKNNIGKWSQAANFST
ncbi:MAG: hypothetical protein ABH835_01675 [Patescibacteria group bacterium]|nr:hypothetical protein [Patescibacteria group bacterium]